MGDERRWPSDARLRERAVHLLAETALFRHVSRRLLADMVAHYGLTELDRIGGPIVGITPAVLLVLEGSVDVVLPASPGMPEPTVLNLPIGSYSRTMPGVHWQDAILRSGGARRARVFLIERAEVKNLPQMLVNQLAPAALQAL